MIEQIIKIMAFLEEEENAFPPYALIIYADESGHLEDNEDHHEFGFNSLKEARSEIIAFAKRRGVSEVDIEATLN